MKTLEERLSGIGVSPVPLQYPAVGVLYNDFPIRIEAPQLKVQCNKCGEFIPVPLEDQVLATPDLLLCPNKCNEALIKQYWESKE